MAIEESEKPNIGSFGNVDSQKEAEEFVKLVTWVEQQPQSVAMRKLSYDRLDPKAGDLALDVGCGTGRAVVEIAERGSRSVGLDVSEKMIGTAKQRFPGHDFRVAAAENLPFDNGSVQRYRAERVYSFLKDPAVALKEARRVLSPEGRIVLIDLDWETWVVDSDSQTITRAIVRAFADTIPQRWMGRRLYSLLRDAGFAAVTVEVHTLPFTDFEQTGPVLVPFVQTAVAASAISKSEGDSWLDEQKARTVSGRFFFAIPTFVASARR